EVGEAAFDTTPGPLPCEDCDYALEQLRVETEALQSPPRPSGKQYFLRVLRREPYGPGCTVCIPDANGKCSAPDLERTAELRFGTDLTFFYPDRLQLRKSEDDWGDSVDELWWALAVNKAAPLTECDSCDGSSGQYQFLGELSEGGPWLGLGKLGPHAFVDNLQVSLYSEATPGDYDTDEEWFVPQGGRHACPEVLPILPRGWGGICSLAENVVNTPIDGGPSYFWYADERVLDDADYDARLHYCMTHEWVGPLPSSPPGANGNLVDACRAWTH
ncbi:MAG: hypothetical protein KDK91_29070, partial [Gammaproteobacteria bacterium]|nr:hypothetical protein [Gammaproteobacteria bacterium]